jgi:hypothetical protein
VPLELVFDTASVTTGCSCASGRGEILSALGIDLALSCRGDFKRGTLITRDGESII